MPYSVVKVHCSKKIISYVEPWRKQPSTNVTGSASLISYNERNFILTNEHVVRGHTQVYLTVEGTSIQFPVNVVYTNHSCDLAILELKQAQKEQFERLVQYKNLDVETIPMPGTKVSTHGFPTGGTGYCLTQGSVSRTEDAMYITYGAPLLRVQIDAAINHGSSGGLAMTQEEPETIIGITSSGLKGGAQNVGYVIPSKIMAQFIKQYLRFENNQYRQTVSFPSLEIMMQSLQQQKLRDKYQLSSTDTATGQYGVLVTKSTSRSFINKHFIAGDVILEIDGRKVKSDGNITYGCAEISIKAYIASTKDLGESAEFTVWRLNIETNEREQINILVQLNYQYDNGYLLTNEPNKALPYYIHTDGAVFLVPDIHYVFAHDAVRNGCRNTTGRPDELNYHMSSKISDKRRQFVYLVKVLETEDSLGIECGANVVESVNGEAISSISQLAQILETATDDVEVKLISQDLFILSPNNPEKENIFCEKQGIQQRMSRSIADFLSLPNSEEAQISSAKQMHHALHRSSMFNDIKVREEVSTALGSVHLTN
ncbi:MAG: S1C family serine protease [Legionella sp.]|nr:S1C family serine protease [Legionella sp.]